MSIKAVEALLQEAIQRGEFKDLPGKGKPVDLADYFNTPEDVRLAYSLLKNANILPEEAELLKEIAGLKEELELCQETTPRKTLRKTIEERKLKLNVLLEGRKGK